MSKVGWITINRNCNNKCNWCYANDVLSNKNSMNLSTVLKCVDYLKSKNVERIVIIGGEPTLYLNLEKLIEYIIKNNQIPVVLTNGIAFSNYKYAEKICKTGINKITISLKGYGSNDYKLTTSTNNFNKVLKGFNNLVKNGVTPNITITVTKNTKEHINEYFDCLVDMCAQNVIFDFGKPYIKNGELVAEETLNPIEMAKFCEDVYERFFKQFKMFKISADFPLCFINNDRLIDMVKKNIISIDPCFVLSGTGIYIDTDLSLLTCNQDIFNKKGKVDINNNNEIIDINYNEFCKSKYDKFEDLCKRCKWYENCRGGCHFVWDYYNIEDYKEYFKNYEVV
ncbi:MAG: radical SAM protein [Oscillospiraceae bacterium]|nr:radical SAM protein [Oscillospiraceae bacterium]